MDIAQSWHTSPKKGKLSPIRTFDPGPGDGTVPAWSAKLVWLKKSQVYNTKWAKEHSALPDHREVHLVIEGIISRGKIPRSIKKRKANKNQFGRPASMKRVEEFFVEISNGNADATDKRFQDPAIWRRILMDTQIG